MVPDPVQDEDEPLRAPSIAELGALLEGFRPRLRWMLTLRFDPRLRKRVEPVDVIQEAFVEVVRRLEEFRARHPMPFFLWVRFLTLQKLAELHQHHLGAACRDAGREATPRAIPASTVSLAELFVQPGPSPSEAVARGEILERVRQALERLPEVDREILALRYFERLSNEETAIVLGLTVSGVAKRQMHALGRLKRQLPQEVPTPP